MNAQKVVDELTEILRENMATFGRISTEILDASSKVKQRLAELEKKTSAPPKENGE